MRCRSIFKFLMVKSGWLLSAVIMMASLAACQPTPEEPIVIGKDQEAMLSAAVKTPEATGEETPEFSLSEMTVPDTYTFNTTGADGKLTVSVDAPVTLPKADRLPTA
jgi:hypothetical protein